MFKLFKVGFPYLPDNFFYFPFCTGQRTKGMCTPLIFNSFNILIFTKTETKSKINITDIPTVNVSIFVIRHAYIRISDYLSICGHLYFHSQSFQVPFVLFKSFKKMSETIYYSTFKTLVFFLVLKKYNVHLPMTAFLIVDIAFVRISP